MPLTNPYRDGSSYHVLFQTLMDADGVTEEHLRHAVCKSIHKAEYLAGNDVKVVLSPRRELHGRMADVRGSYAAQGHLYYAEQDAAGIWRVFPCVPPMSKREREAPGDGPRTLRQRGCDVAVGDYRFYARSVPELFERTLSYLQENGHLDRLPEGTLPFPRGKKRYLIACEPRHRDGDDFTSPVRVGSYVMEAHRDYDNACSQLAEFLAVCGVAFNAS
jgi:hypothetical protein